MKLHAWNQRYISVSILLQLNAPENCLNVMTLNYPPVDYGENKYLNRNTVKVKLKNNMCF